MQTKFYQYRDFDHWLDNNSKETSSNTWEKNFWKTAHRKQICLGLQIPIGSKLIWSGRYEKTIVRPEPKSILKQLLLNNSWIIPN